MRKTPYELVTFVVRRDSAVVWWLCRVTPAMLCRIVSCRYGMNTVSHVQVTFGYFPRTN